MNEDRTFPAGTESECNRCKTKSPLPKPCVGHFEAYTRPSRFQVYRLDTMAMLPCGHLDAHWVTIFESEHRISIRSDEGVRLAELTITRQPDTDDADFEIQLTETVVHWASRSGFVYDELDWDWI